ncbi:cytochrome P450 [Ilumatobacter coccineus]|uniref:Cytochrome P450 n=1 Tax=Ilumatobacter coccineus (strain NBRC 103263 / KCTC 29153 / YM16-304) TaxID=1313172 RepID=A0A6C7EFQ7_ILUCY|nr:cytochrome P450 [Ilumatobacter coccineus]BAN03855.1 cytochrome P450 [Ilumatobacter coccineus YM16-304]
MAQIDVLVERITAGDADFIHDPYPTLDELREATPIVWNEATQQWMVTRFADVSAALKNRSLGRDYTHRFTHEELGREAPDARWARFNEHERWSLLSIEPPDHTRLRRLVSKVFTPRSVNRLADDIARFSDDLLDRCDELGTFDLLADYAQPYSVAVICSMLGVPTVDTQRLLDWSHAIVKMYELSASDDTKRAADDAAAEFIEYTRALIAEKRAHPDGLLVSELARVEDEGDTLTEAEIISTTMVLLEAGHEATVNTLGNGFRALMHHRDQWERVTSGAVTYASAVEELLRFDAPLHMFERWVLEPGVEIAGQRLEVGDEIAMLFGSAQRDPRRFDDPDTFDVGRDDPAHVGFGGGIHFCIGAPLARQELARSVQGFAERFPDLRLVVEPTYHPTFVIRGLTELRLSTS